MHHAVLTAHHAPAGPPWGLIVATGTAALSVLAAVVWTGAMRVFVGTRAAVRALAVLLVSATVFAVACWWLGTGTLAQVAAAVAASAPVFAGHRWLYTREVREALAAYLDALREGRL